MHKQYKKSIFIFRRDLRIEDNTGLIEAIKLTETVIPIFNFDPLQISSKNKYKSDNAIQFMTESLYDLDKQLKQKNGKLYCFYGDIIKNLESIIKKENIEAVFLNSDYTPFSIRRDKNIKNLCEKNNIKYHSSHDLLLIGNPANLKNQSGKAYIRFSSFFKQATKIRIFKPKEFPKIYNFYNKNIINQVNLDISKKIIKKDNINIKVHGGTSNNLKILKNLDRFSNYNLDRDYPALDSTTHLSAANKFGVISIREIYYKIKEKLGISNKIITELYWRDYFSYLAFNYPHVFGKPFYKKFEKLKWSNNKENFKLWCTGNTGFPIIDAGMRQLNTTGWMHNRVRMLTASFLVKDLQINWLWGEKYFATKLVDYDPAINNGNWQWVASTGAEYQPYFRIFNPWLQQKKYDKDCKYIKKWIPELNKIKNNIINNWFKFAQKKIGNIKYKKPILDHNIQKNVILKNFKLISSK